jgi:hypothetical protein
VLSGDNISG